MKVKGIKRGNIIELVGQPLDLPDGTEITVTIEAQPPTPPTDALERLRQIIAEPASAAIPLTDLIGSAPGSFATPEAADQFIREQRDAWDY